MKKTLVLKSTRPKAPNQNRVALFVSRLPTGKANALTAAQLCAEFGWPATESAKRHIRLLSEYAVEAGHPVCGDNTGYFLPASPAEIEDTLARLDSGITHLSERRRKLVEACNHRFVAAQPALI